MSDEIYRVVLLGKQATGKTCIIAQFINGSFDPGTISSLTAQFIRKTIQFADGRNITLDIWDTAGQEKYRAIAKIYYKEARAVILVYDITDESSFIEMKEYWYEQVKLYAKKDVIFAVAANKNDLDEERKISDEEGKKFANEIGAIFALVSAKTGDCVTSLFENCIKKYLSPDYVAVVNKQRIIRKEKNLIEVREPKEKKKKLFC